VLASLARGLRLDDDQRTYLHDLAGTNTAATKSRRRAPQKVKPYLQRVLDHHRRPRDRDDADPTTSSPGTRLPPP
jgi:hypothetical protein